MLIRNVEVTFDGFVPFKGELEKYVDDALKRDPDIVRLHFRANPDDKHGIIVDYSSHHTPFERIRRITGKRIAVRRQAA